MKYVLGMAVATALFAAIPASAEEVGIGVGPVGVGVTVGSGPGPGYYRDRDDGYYRDRETVVRERDPRDRTVIINRDRRGDRDRGVIVHEND